MKRPLAVCCLAAALACATSTPPPAQKPPEGPPPTARDVKCRAGGGTAHLPGDPAAAARAYIQACGRAEVVELTRALVAFPTVRAEEKTFPQAADEMAKYLQGVAADLGGTFQAVDGREVFEVSFGDPAAPVGVAFVTHGDVVPVGTNWTKKPYEATVEGDLLYGRGTEDDKGPTAAALVAMRALAAAGYHPKQRVQLIVGMGEEHDWKGMQQYAKEVAPPRYVVSLDADFPVVISEYGFVGWTLVSKGDGGPATPKEKCARVVSAEGGTFLTQVPPEATATLAPPPGEPYAKFLARVQELVMQDIAARGAPFSAEVSVGPGTAVKIRTAGKSVHTSEAYKGANPLWPLSAIAVKAGACRTGAGRLLHVLAARFDGDHWGEKLGVAYADPVMGKLLAIPTVLKAEAGKATLGVNMRRPAGMDNAAFGQKLDAALASLSKDFGGLEEDAAQRFLGEPHVADIRGDLVPTLLSIYGELTGEKDPKPITIRGGTYARLFPGAVSFGPELPGETYRGHAPDESIKLPTLDLLTRAAVEVVLRLDGRDGRDSRALDKSNP